MSEPNGQESQRSQMVGAVGQYTGYGLTWAMATGLFLGCGWWLDGKVGTAPLFTIIGAFVGGGAGFFFGLLLLEPLFLRPRGAESTESI